ncbi:GNAT family N-acetyltransferase [Telmatospirillum sp. J64-1]|uniref:GNAT family N-acetyltransferase n=1 Tax=Telmatospirillum sp. J64-1 TaxID=2502183 RepID=UPI002102052F|nr:GNAT family N-acetyltransferase [Telmatospirillum sp. J64-1]
MDPFSPMVRIRKARPADAERLPEVERSAGKAFLAIADLAWIADDEVQSAERHLELIAGGFSWVAFDGEDVPVGFLSAEKCGNRLHLWELAVAQRHQGQGIGRRLLQQAVEAARSDSLEAVTLSTFRDVPWNRPFYERLGFRTLEAGEMPAALQAVLDEEVARGLPGERRCAMMLALR